MDIISTPSIPEPTGQGEPLRSNDEYTGSDPGDFEPVEDFSKHDNPVLHSLGIDDEVSNLPTEQQDNLKEVEKYVMDSLKQEGKQETIQSFKNKIESLKWELGFDNDTEPTIIIDKIANIVKSWRSISFIRNPQERKSILMKLARCNTADDMDRLVFNELERRKVWR